MQPFGALSAASVAQWSALQQQNPALRSPFYRPEYHSLVDRAQRAHPEPDHHPGVEVVTATTAQGEAVAFFPFERHEPPSGRAGLPSGRLLSDYQGLVASPSTDLDPVAVLRAGNLLTWRFDHVPVDQTCFEPSSTTTAASPVIDVSAGFEAYSAATHAARAEQRKRRRLEREVGPIRFEPHTKDPQVLAALTRWKSAQYEATGATDVFAIPWCRAVAEDLINEDHPHFQGALSALWAGDHLVAAHLGMISDRVWHWWIPAYGPEWSRHSPGTVLLLELARASAERNIAWVDLGKGDQLYKDRVSNDQVWLAKGTVQVPSMRTVARRAARRIRRIRTPK